MCRCMCNTSTKRQIARHFFYSIWILLKTIIEYLHRLNSKTIQMLYPGTAATAIHMYTMLVHMFIYRSYRAIYILISRTFYSISYQAIGGRVVRAVDLKSGGLAVLVVQFLPWIRFLCNAYLFRIPRSWTGSVQMKSSMTFIRGNRCIERERER